MEEMDQKPVKWYFSIPAMIAGYLIVGPFMLPMVWLHPRYSVKMKIALTVAVVILTVILGIVFARALQTIGNYYQLMTGL